jgi:hypothetical protein
VSRALKRLEVSVSTWALWAAIGALRTWRRLAV